MRQTSKNQCLLFRHLITVFIGAAVSYPLACDAQSNWCRCPGGVAFQAGLVNYKGNSDREVVTRIEVKETDPERRCEAAWIGYSEVYAEGTPYSFHLRRKHMKTIREEACGESANSFVSRIKTYRFVVDGDSQSIRTVDPVIEPASPRPDSRDQEKSNANLWDSIATAETLEPVKGEKPGIQSAAAPEFIRTAWVMARRDIKGHYVALVRGIDQRQGIIPLSKVRTIEAGELGQIEASNGRTALVRFYAGSRQEKFGRERNAFRRWYNDIGGPYTETHDDLFSRLRACILEVPLDDILEVNDYLDQQHKDQT